jgi:hypothetical protein
MRLVRHSHFVATTTLADNPSAIVRVGAKMLNHMRVAACVFAIVLLVAGREAVCAEELSVANAGNNSVTVYTRTASGNTAPIRILSGLATGLSGPTDLAVDTVNNELVVANFSNNSVTVYSRTASGNTAPTRTLQGSTTALTAASELTMDTENNVTELHNPISLAVDTVNNELVVLNYGNNTVTVYTRTVSGNTAPIRILSLSGAAGGGVSLPGCLAVDTVNNELVVLERGLNAVNSTVAVYSRTASGNTAPVRILSLSGVATGLLTDHFCLAVDTVNNELVVSNIGNNTVTVHSRTASGNTAPIRTLSGAATGLDAPIRVAVDTVNNELVVSNYVNGPPMPGVAYGTVTVYGRTASGNTAPIRTLSGATTGLNLPEGLAVTTTSPQTQPIPTLHEWGAALLSLLLVVAGFVRIRRHNDPCTPASVAAPKKLLGDSLRSM